MTYKYTMPETTAPDTAVTDPTATDASASEGEESKSERPDPNVWLRSTTSGLLFSRPLEEGAEELGKRDADEREDSEPEETPERTAQQDADGQADEQQEQPSAKREFTEEEFQRAIQAETDRREASRLAKEQRERERQLRRSNPNAYAQQKELEEQQLSAAEQQAALLRTVSQGFDEAAITPLVNQLDPETKAKVLRDPGHGIDGRKEIVKRTITALKKQWQDEGYKKGATDTERKLRRSRTLRGELLAELRGGDDEPELAPAAGGAEGRSGFDANEWMRRSLSKR